jgi:putative sporulation protein YyaC
MASVDYEQVVSLKETMQENGITADDIVVVCIGTDRSTGDCLGPMVGNYLKGRGYKNIYGTLEKPVNAENIVELMKVLPKDKLTIVVDAALTDQDSEVGNVSIISGGINPGVAVGKELPEIGDISIVGCVAKKEKYGELVDTLLLQSVRLGIVIDMVKEIGKIIRIIFPKGVKSARLKNKFTADQLFMEFPLDEVAATIV